MSRDLNTAQDFSTIEASSKAHRLIGWLVSYKLDSNGAAFEIRSGRIFISSTALLPAGQNGNSSKEQHCIVLNDKSVSSLHLALLATNSHQIFIQDIFSEHGTFLTKAGESEETRITGICELQHGDWIRLGGENRFQVCLIDGRRN